MSLELCCNYNFLQEYLVYNLQVTILRIILLFLTLRFISNCRFPQLTAISKILWIITVIATSVFGSGSNIQLYSACSAKHVHVYSNGSVFANDDSQTPRKYGYLNNVCR